MSKLIFTLLFILSAQALAYFDKKDFNESKHRKVRETKSHILKCDDSKKIKKKSPKYSKYSHKKFKYKKNKNNKYFSTEVVESDNPLQLRLKIVSEKKKKIKGKGKGKNKYKTESDKYDAYEVRYNIGQSADFSSLSSSAIIEEDNGEKFINIDLTDIEPGQYIASLRILTHKAKNDKKKKSHKRGKKHKYKKKKKTYVFDISLEFERIQLNSAYLIADNYRSLDGNASVYFDTSGSYSDFGEIVSFNYKEYLEGDLKSDETIDVTTSIIRFREVGNWKVIITAIDSLGATDSQEFNFVVTNATPSVTYSYELSESTPGHILIDLSESTDPDGDELVSFESFYYKVEEDGTQVYWKYLPHGTTVDTNLVNRGQNYICLRVTDARGAFDVQCFFVEFNGNIAPYHFYRTIEQQGEDPRSFYFDSFCFDNDGIAASYSMRATTNFNGEDFEIEKETTTSDFSIIIPRPGTWNITSSCTDNDGTRSNIQNTTQGFNYDLGAPDVNLTLSPQNGINTDTTFNTNYEITPSPYAESISIYDITVIKDGIEISSNQYTSEPQSLTFPSSGNFEVVYRIVDNLGISSNAKSVYVTINGKPIANYIIQKDFSGGYNKYIIINNSTDSDGEVVSTEVKASNLTNGNTIDSSFSGQNSPLSLEEGFWNISIIAVDNQGGRSDSFSTSLDIVNQAPIADFTFIGSDNNPSLYTFTSNSNDDGLIVKYIVKNGSDLLGEFQSSPFDLILDKEENNISITAIDETGKESIPWTTLITIERPVIDFSISESNQKYFYNISISIIKEDLNNPINKFFVKIGDTIEEYQNQVIKIGPLNENGTYIFEVFSETTIGLRSDIVIKSLLVSEPAIGNDIIPEKPDIDFTNLIGVDSDFDGIRDDVELNINFTFTQQDSNERRSVANFAKSLHTIVKENNTASFKSGSQIIRLRLSMQKCLQKKFKQENVDYIINNLFTEYFNNPTRAEYYFGARYAANGLVIEENDGDLYAEACTI